MEGYLGIKELSIREKIKYFFINPEKIFEQYIKKPVSLIKFIIIISSASFYAFAMSTQKNLIIDSALKSVKGNPNITQSALDATKQISDVMYSAPMLIFEESAKALLTIFLISLIYWIIIRSLKGENSYKDTIAVYTLAYIPKAIYSLFLGIYIIATNSFPLIDSLFKPTYSTQLLSKFTPFSIWQIVLLIIGFSKIGKISKKKSTIIVLGITVVYALYAVVTINK